MKPTYFNPGTIYSYVNVSGQIVKYTRQEDGSWKRSGDTIPDLMRIDDEYMLGHIMDRLRDNPKDRATWGLVVRGPR